MTRLALLSIAAFAVAACSTSEPPPEAPPLPAPAEIAGFAHPEGMLVAGQHIYVSNFGAEMNPTAKDGDGFISELSVTGAVVKLRAVEGLNAPKGMAMLGGTLFVVDIDTVVGINIATGARVLEVKSPNVNAFLNDIAVEDGDALLATDTANNAVFRVRPSAGTMTQLAGDIPGANGIAVAEDRSYAIVVGTGANFNGAGGVYSVSLPDGAVRRLGDAQGPFDGIVILPGGNYLVSDWVSLQGAPGAVREYGASGANVRDIPLATEMHGPADIAYDTAASRLWIPRLPDNVVSTLTLP